MNRHDLRGELVAILTKAIARGDAPEHASAANAERVLDELVASDDAPAWADVRVGREQLALVIAVYRSLPELLDGFTVHAGLGVPEPAAGVDAHVCPHGPLCEGWEEHRLVECDGPGSGLTADCDHRSCWSIIHEMCRTCYDELSATLADEAYGRSNR